MDAKTRQQTDWSKCCLCQVDKRDETLISPLSSFQRKQDYAGYEKIAKNVPLFYALNDMPIPFNPARLDEGEGIEATLIRNKAKYHQSCRLLFNNTKLSRAQKRKITPSTSGTEENREKRQRTSDPPEVQCFLCEEEDEISNLRQAMTMQLNERLNQCARTLNNGKLLAKLSAGDVVAQELKYHPRCLAKLYNSERAHLNVMKQEENDSGPGKDVYPLAFSELVIYIMDSMVTGTETTPVIFRLADLASLYKRRLQQLGVESPEVNSTRLKEQLLSRIPELEAHKKGRDVLLAFRKDVSTILSDASKYSEAIHLAKAADIIRKEMLAHKTKFSQAFQEGFGEEAVPQALLQFVCSIEHGVDIRSHLNHGIVQSDVAIAQLLQFNCYSKYREGSKSQRHVKDRETPFAVYVGMKVFAKTRKRQLIDKLHENGISISYDRVLEISGQLGETVVKQYVEDDVVCPPNLRKGLFTTSAVDNIDHNPTATTSSTSFHGTSISMFQHPSSDNVGEARILANVAEGRTKKVPDLPESYTNIPPAFFRKKNPEPSIRDDFSLPDPSLFQEEVKLENEWLEKVHNTTDVDGSPNVTWSAHHASNQRAEFVTSINALLPLLRDQAHSVATIKHAMDKIKETVSFLNPGQTPVITADQPLYALAKQIQWHWPDIYGEDKFVIMFGGLHIEMTAFKSIGSMLEGSGWTGALVEAEIASSGSADSFLSATNVTKTRQAHQVTASSLFKLLKKGYSAYLVEQEDSDEKTVTFEEWCGFRSKESPLFQFWFLILNMELTILTLIRAFREGNFALYRESLAELIPYFFANNNVNYARWLPVHLRDMMSLERQHPEVAQQFQNGNFVVHKSDRHFSSVAIDQAHEQNNASIKGDGGAIGLTEDPAALRRWMVAGPEIRKLVTDYETASGSKDVKSDTRHHEQSPAAQKTFLEKVQRLTMVLEEMGNPFTEVTGDLLTLDTKDIAESSAAERVATHLQKGKEQFKTFMDKLNDGQYFYQSIKKNSIDFFKTGTGQSKQSEKKLLKEDCHLFSRLFISCQTRGCDLQEFFKHENQSFPPSLSKNGNLRPSTKSDLVEILQGQVQLPESKPESDVLIVDGASLVNTVAPKTPKTFEEYAQNDILPLVQNYSHTHKRTDIIFDVYHKTSLKSEARSKRGKAIRRRVTAKSKPPTNWKSFLRDSTNKSELFHFLADAIAEMTTSNAVLVTREENVLTSANYTNFSLEELAPCTHEEADTRIFLHAWHAAKEGYKSVLVDANDTDIVVIAISMMPSLTAIGLQEMWVRFGKGEHTRWIPIHDLVSNLGPEKSKGMLFFHAFTGCDVVSSFNGKGKKTALQTWNVFNEVSATFAKLSLSPSEIEESDLQVLEKYVILMYDRSSATSSVDDARLDLFARKQRSYDLIPPTQNALKEHAKRAAYQAGHVWGQSVIRDPELQCPSKWGWSKEDDSWKIVWTSLEPISKCCSELTKCGCKTDCGGRCKCKKTGLHCTKLCSCPCQASTGTLEH